MIMLIHGQCFISGRIHKPEQDTTYQRAEKLSFSSAQHVHRNMYSEKLYSLKKIHFVSGYWNAISSHGVHLSTIPQESKKFQIRNHRRIARCNWIKPEQLKHNSIFNRQPLQPRQIYSIIRRNIFEYTVTS